MSIIYNLVYILSFLFAIPWLGIQAIRTGKYRQGWWQKLLGCVQQRYSQQPCVWFHAVSVGEVNLLTQIVHQWQQRHPDWDVAITSTTRTGFALAKQRFPGLLVDYYPLDFSWAVRRAMRRIRPHLLVMAELELWPNFIGEAKRRGIPVAVINGRLSESSFRGYRRVGRLVQTWLRSIGWIGAQSETYRDRFVKLGARPQKVSCTGSLKFDRAEFDRENLQTIRLKQLVGLKGNDPVWVVGSTQDPEEAMAIRVYERLVRKYPNLKLIIVPRHAERFHEVMGMLRRTPIKSLQRSQLKTPINEDWQVLLVDTIGELGAWWGAADIAFVGGSMGSRGGQNMIEPAAYGAAVCFGPNTRNFRDVVQRLLERGAAQVVESENDLFQFVSQSIQSPEGAAEMGQRAQELVRMQQGATDRTLRGMEQLLGENALEMSASDQQDTVRAA
ncbi:MAG: 3-deoxy-D-manno-octulosonic acid transferase [Planctomycetota bacterium]|nr:3-deoxy-D-manno-octulosonic acid transferase [Planctomycetota bacterium]